MSKYKYIYPPNARSQEQLDIMLRMEAENKDPMDPEYIEQEILFQTDYWYISKNRFPYDGAELQFLVVSMASAYDITEISLEAWADLQQVWERLIQEYSLDGGALCMRFGNPARSGASLTRVHCHIIQPKLGEKVRPGIGGRTTLKDNLHL